MRKDYWAKLEPNLCYHIYNRAIGTDNLFLNPEHYDFFLSRWEKYMLPYFSLYAYCLMPNHFHLLAQARPLDEQVLEQIKENPSKKAAAFIRGEIGIDIFYTDCFKSFFTSYSGAFNKEQKRHGSLFQQKFKRIIIRNHNHFLEKFHYIHHNPIHHLFCKNYEDWRFSSYHAYAYSGDHRLLAKATVMDLFNQDIHELRKSHRAYQENFRPRQQEEES
jgi:putative transposase